jgi:menaquinol-cytochrome c reductase iron-sulfur subunit
MTELPVTSSLAPENPAVPARRGVLAGLAALVTGAAITLAPLSAGIMFALDPIRRRRPRFQGADKEGYLPVVDLNQLPTDGTPVRFTIRADLIDAWNLFKDRTIGTVYLRNVENNVIAFTDVCPHLGCKINYQSSSQHFFCPCHASTFDLEGAKINEIPPRNMDSLPTKVEGGRVWVKYQDFRGGIHEKEAIG